ncbi:MAG: alpha/beta fold hydrolase [bacterium]|nr:alpha/beta fold hydrolase [bacterium]
MPPFQNPVIVIPGITATTMDDKYPLDTRHIWTMVLNREYERLALHPDDIRYETHEPSQVVAGRLFSVYDDLIDALRHDLSERADRPTPVFAFPYDWRRALDRTAAELRDFIEEVIARTRLLRHYAGSRRVEKVDLVGHSMGGLVICEYLHHHDRERRVGKVATMGTPYQGSAEAVVKLATGLGNLSRGKPSEREREAARTMPAIYQLLPSYGRAVVDRNTSRSVSLFSANNWQRTILESLAEYVRLHSVKPNAEQKKEQRAASLLRAMLRQARQHRGHVLDLDLEQAGLSPRQWLAIIGTGQETRIRVEVDRAGDRTRFYFSDEHWKNQERDTGDGTVALLSAIPPFLSAENGVCVTPDDLSRFEFGDRVLLHAAGFHGILANVNLVQRLVIKHLRPTFTGRVWGRPAPGVAKGAWAPPIENLPSK